MGLIYFRIKESVSSVVDVVSLGRGVAVPNVHMLRISKERERNEAVLCEWTAWNVFQDISYGWDAVSVPLVCEWDTFHSNVMFKYYI